jgi:hypothetical protein
MVITDYTAAQLNSNIFPKADDIDSAGPLTIQALFAQFKDCDLDAISADHAAAEAVIAPFFNDATTVALKKAVLEHIFKVIESAATQPSVSVIDHDTTAFNTDKELLRCILFRFSQLAHFDLPFGSNFVNIKTAVQNANSVMDDLFFDKAHAASQLVRVANAQDALAEQELLGGLDNFSTHPEASTLLKSRPLVDMFDAKVFTDEADFMQRFSRFCAKQCNWSFNTAGIADASTMAAIMVCMEFDYSDFPFPSTVSDDARWAILSFFYSRYMLRSERAFEGLPNLEWPGVHALAVKLGKLCAMKSARFATGPKANMRPTPVEALRILFVGIGDYLTHSDKIHDLEHCLFLKLRRGGLSDGAISEAIKCMVITTKDKHALTPTESSWLSFPSKLQTLLNKARAPLALASLPQSALARWQYSTLPQSHRSASPMPPSRGYSSVTYATRLQATFSTNGAPPTKVLSVSSLLSPSSPCRAPTIQTAKCTFGCDTMTDLPTSRWMQRPFSKSASPTSLPRPNRLQHSAPKLP